MTSTYSISGTFLYNNAGQTFPINDVPISAYKASRCSGLISGGGIPQGTPPPSGTADASTTTSTDYGTVGAWVLPLPTSEPYWVVASYSSSYFWHLYNTSDYLDGSSGTSAEVDPGVLGSSTQIYIGGEPVSSSAPSSGDGLVYNGTDWAPASVPTSTLASVELAARGLVSENFNPQLSATAGQSALTERAYGVMVPFLEGMVITNICLTISTIAVGTAPTHAVLGVASMAGEVLAQTADVASSTNWTGATSKTIIEFPLTSTYTVPSNEALYLILWVDGSWGTTQPTFLSAISSTTPWLGLGSEPTQSVTQASVTSFPATGSSFTFTTGTDANYWWMGAS